MRLSGSSSLLGLGVLRRCGVGLQPLSCPFIHSFQRHNLMSHEPPRVCGKEVPWNSVHRRIPGTVDTGTQIPLNLSPRQQLNRVPRPITEGPRIHRTKLTLATLRKASATPNPFSEVDMLTWGASNCGRDPPRDKTNLLGLCEWPRRRFDWIQRPPTGAIRRLAIAANERLGGFARDPLGS